MALTVEEMFLFEEEIKPTLKWLRDGGTVIIAGLRARVARNAQLKVFAEEAATNHQKEQTPESDEKVRDTAARSKAAADLLADNLVTMPTDYVGILDQMLADIPQRRQFYEDALATVGLTIEILEARIELARSAYSAFDAAPKGSPEDVTAALETLDAAHPKVRTMNGPMPPIGRLNK